MAKILAKNIGFLTLSQAANYVLPLITIPYVTRVVGPDNYGLIEFGTVVMLYFSAIVIYGFNTTATRKIAAKPQDVEHVSSIFSTVVATRLVLFLATSIVFFALLFTVPVFYSQLKMMLFAYPIVLGWALYPDFLFQGLQKLKFVAISNFLVKAIAAALIIVFIKSPDDFFLVLAINAAAQILVGITLLMTSTRLVPGLRFSVVGLTRIKKELKEGSYVFFSLFFTRVYTFGSILFLGFMLSDYELGLFAASLKLVTVAQSFLFLPLFGALFPYLSNLYANDFSAYKNAFKRMLGLIFVVTVISSAVLVLVPKPFVLLVFGADYLDATPYLQIMAPLLVATTISHFSMQQGLIIFHKDKTYLFLVITVGLLSLLVNYLGIRFSGLEGAAWAKLSIEVLLAVLGVLFFYPLFNRSGSSGQ